jgi:ATP-dependent Lhr-like helicase
LYAEVRQTAAFAELSLEGWQVPGFVRWRTDGDFTDYQRVVPDDEGIWRVPDGRPTRYRPNTFISSDASMVVQFWSAGGRRGRPAGVHWRKLHRPLEARRMLSASRPRAGTGAGASDDGLVNGHAQNRVGASLSGGRMPL